jgi:hypothetical protein
MANKNEKKMLPAKNKQACANVRAIVCAAKYVSGNCTAKLANDG